jgi:hypothetical protein
MRYNSISLVTPQYTIPILKIDKPCETLSHEFYSLTEHLEYSFDLDSLRNTQTEQIYKEPKVESKIPAHIIAAYVESLLNKNEVCPITMEPLESSSLYITECGHAMSKSAACRWITEKNSCPVCRVECSFRA